MDKDLAKKIKQLQKDIQMKHITKMQSGGAIYPQPASTNTQPYLGFPNGDFQYNPNQPNFRPNMDMSPTSTPDLGAVYNPMTDNNYQALQGAQATEYVAPDAQALDTTPQPIYNDINRTQLYNPYTGVSLENALFSFGQSLGYDGDQKGANAIRGGAAAGKIALAGARSILSGAGYQKANERSYNDYVDKLYNAAPNYSYAQKGGEITNADVLTGAYTVGTMQANVEVENNEQIQLPTGEIQKVVGDTHENGGVKTQLESGSKILSDHTKIGAQNAKLFRKELDVKAKATDTYASVMDKYNKKVGWTTIIEDEKKTIEDIGNQEQGDVDTTTKDINLSFLSEKLQGLQAEKDLVNPLQNEAFNKIFEKQEANKPKSEKQIEKTVMQEGGEIDPKIAQLAKQYNLSPERVMELIQKQNPNPDIQGQISQALEQGTPPEQIMQSLVESGMSEEQAMQLMETFQQPQQSFQAGGTFFTPSPYAQDAYGYQPYVGDNVYAAGIESEEQIIERLKLQNQNLPYIVKPSGIYSDNAGAFPNLKNTEKFQKRYDDYIGQTLVEIDNSEFLTEEQKAAYKKQADSQRLALSIQDGTYDNKYGQETSSRTGFTLPYLTVEEQKQYPNLKFIGDAIGEDGKLKSDFSNLSPETQQRIMSTYGRGKDNSLNIGLGVVPTTEAPAEIAEQDPEIINRRNTILRQANLPVDFLLPPSPMQAVYKPNVTLGRIDPVKISIEPNLIEADRQRQSTAEALNYLPDSQRTAAMASILGQTQATTNQAITGAETVNAQNQYVADGVNLQQRDKQQLLDAEIDTTYEGKVFQTQANAERDLRRYFTQLNLNNRQNFADIRDLNLLNAATPNYQTDGQNIYFNEQPLNFTNAGGMNSAPMTYSQLSPKAKEEYMKRVAQQIAKNRNGK